MALALVATRFSGVQHRRAVLCYSNSELPVEANNVKYYVYLRPSSTVKSGVDAVAERLQANSCACGSTSGSLIPAPAFRRRLRKGWLNFPGASSQQNHDGTSRLRRIGFFGVMNYN